MLRSSPRTHEVVESLRGLWHTRAESIRLDILAEGSSMRIVLFMAILANSLDLVATALGIHWLGNREGNPLLAPLAHHHWWVFVLVKGLLIPILIVQLYRYRNSTPTLATTGMAIVTIALTVAVGQWLGWIAGVIHVTQFMGL
jgi:uncharacterized membrane protein